MCCFFKVLVIHDHNFCRVLQLDSQAFPWDLVSQALIWILWADLSYLALFKIFFPFVEIIGCFCWVPQLNNVDCVARSNSEENKQTENCSYSYRAEIHCASDMCADVINYIHNLLSDLQHQCGVSMLPIKSYCQSELRFVATVTTGGRVKFVPGV